MKKQLLVAAVAAASALSFSSALAADTLTLYGQVNIMLDSFDSGANGSKAAITAADPYTGSRWGIRGSEEISSGLKGIFQLEARVRPTGTPASLGFGEGRHWFVGLDTSAGQFKIGQTTDAQNAIANPWDNGYFLNPTKSVSFLSANGASRFVGLHWVSPKWADAVTVAVSYSGDYNNDKGLAAPYLDTGIRWEAYNFLATLGYSELTAGEGAAPNADNATKSKSTVTNVSFSYNIQGDTWSVRPLIAYEIGNSKPSVGDSTKQNAYALNVPIIFGQDRVLLAYGKLDGAKVGSGAKSKATKDNTTIEYTWALSKRTNIVFGYQQIKDTNASDVSTTSKEAIIGVGHRF